MSPTCTHDGGPLEKGLVVGDTIRCPWHHAYFSLRTGEALGAPAFDPIACWAVERDHEKVLVRGKREDPGERAVAGEGADLERVSRADQPRRTGCWPSGGSA